MSLVRKAVIPAAGFGTRFLPATKSQPKEMLPIVDRPTIQFVVEEAIASGLHDILIITSSEKRSIEDHFDKDAELERRLAKDGKDAELSTLRRLSDLANIHYIRQKEPLGLGDALRYAHQHVEDEPFALLLGDTIVRSQEPCTQQLMRVFDFQGRSIIGLEKVPHDKVERYGIIAGKPINGRLYLLEDLIEKPTPAKAPSDLAIGGRYILTPRIFECIEKTPAGKNGEIQLTDAIRLMKNKEPVCGYHFEWRAARHRQPAGLRPDVHRVRPRARGHRAGRAGVPQDDAEVSRDPSLVIAEYRQPDIMQAGVDHESGIRSQESRLPSVCVIILNYNGRKLLGRFLPLIARTDYQPLELVVVDNASTDDSCGWLRARWPQVTLLQQDRNLGYAGGNNIGVRYALKQGHRYIVIANNDIEPHPSWVREAVTHATAHADHGIIGFRLFSTDAERTAFEADARQWQPASWCKTDNVVGCSMFCDAAVFRSIGLFDECYEFYAEELDFEIRAQAAGWRMAQVSVPVWHLGEGSTRKMGLRRAYLSMRNLIRMTLKLDGLRRGLRAVATVFNRACNPSLRLDFEADYTLRRYRPSSLPVNAALAAAATGWNLLALPHTLYAGWRDRGRVARHVAQQKT